MSFEGNCRKGQGEYGAFINDIRGLDLKTCKSNCQAYGGCIAIDFTNTNTFKSGSSCRMYEENTPRSDAGEDNRIYCAFEEKGGKN